MATLYWGIRESLFNYVTGMARGSVEFEGGAEQTDKGIKFPSADDPDYPLAFRGTVTLKGHGGMLHIVIGDPVLHREEDGTWLLSAAGRSGQRAPLAAIDRLGEDDQARVYGGTTTLHPAGVATFGGQYPEGSELDSPIIQL